MNQFVRFSALSIVALCLAACGDDSQPTAETTEEWLEELAQTRDKELEIERARLLGMPVGDLDIDLEAIGDVDIDWSLEKLWAEDLGHNKLQGQPMTLRNSSMRSHHQYLLEESCDYMICALLDPYANPVDDPGGEWFHNFKVVKKCRWEAERARSFGAAIVELTRAIDRASQEVYPTYGVRAVSQPVENGRVFVVDFLIDPNDRFMWILDPLEKRYCILNSVEDAQLLGEKLLNCPELSEETGSPLNDPSK